MSYPATHKIKEVNGIPDQNKVLRWSAGAKRDNETGIACPKEPHGWYWYDPTTPVHDEYTQKVSDNLVSETREWNGNQVKVWLREIVELTAQELSDIELKLDTRLEDKCLAEAKTRRCALAGGSEIKYNKAKENWQALRVKLSEGTITPEEQAELDYLNLGVKKIKRINDAADDIYDRIQGYTFGNKVSIYQSPDYISTAPEWNNV